MQLFFSNRLHLVKPDLNIYNFCLQQLKVLPPEALFVDDKEENVEAAQKLGMKAILFSDYDSLVEDLKAQTA